MRRVLSLLVLAAVLGVTGQAVMAQTLPGEQMTIVVTDGKSVRAVAGGLELASSFVGLVATIKSEQRVAFMTADNPSAIIGPMVADGPTFKSVYEEIVSRISISRSSAESDIYDSLVAAYNLLGIERAAAGSSVYLVLGDNLSIDPDSLNDRIAPLMSQFGDNGWPVHGVSLPGASEKAVGVLRSAAGGSGGHIMELGIPDGFRVIADGILRDSAKGSLDELGAAVLSANDLLTSSLRVAPGTEEATLVFFRDAPYGSLHLSNPSGFEASTGDRTASFVFETPHVVVWRLKDPVPGQWKVDARGVEGLVSAWQYSSNRYRLVLESSAPLPTDEPTTLVAYASDDQLPVVLDTARFYVSLTAPAGTTVVHELNDRGTDGDSAAGDGYYSATIPPLEAEGEYRARLELVWPDFDLRITSNSSIHAQGFPAVEIRQVAQDGLNLGERTKVAEVQVHVDGQPYAVSDDQIFLAPASSEAGDGVFELQAQRVFGDGSSWLYDVYFTPTAEGFETVSIRLVLDYAGRSHMHSSGPIVVETLAPPVPVIEAAAPVEIEPTAPDVRPVSAPQIPAAAFVTEESGFPWLQLAIPLAVLAAILALAAYWKIRPGPRGFLYNDRDELVADLAGMSRHPVMNFLFKGSLSGREMRIPGLEDVSFHFWRRRIGIRGGKGARGVRVNNQPLLGEAGLHDRTWIGSGGRLYSFLLSPLSTGQEPAGAGD